MVPCQNCGKLNSVETNFCRFCGTKFTVRPTVVDNPYDYSAPQPYAWKSDEFQTHNEARRTHPTSPIIPGTDQFAAAAPLVHQAARHMNQPFRCPRCMSHFPPRMERRISTAGWITFAVLLVFFFPLFWIGLLIKENVAICQSCSSKIT